MADYKPKAIRPELLPTPTAPKGALKPCITCGRLVRWPLKTCFDCNRVALGGDVDRRFIYFI